MRQLSEITAPLLPPVTFSPGRAARRFYATQTCLVLVQHREAASKLALYVSDCNDETKGVWIPKSWMTIERADRGKFLVVTMSIDAARRKAVFIGRIPTEGLTEVEAAQLADAKNAAALRQQHMGPKTFDRCNGRDRYA